MTVEPRLQLHLGCGRRYIPGFVHVDISDHPHIDVRHRIDHLPMFGDETVDLIYCCHAFEYFDRQEAPDVLAEWRRVLKPGGTLRLAVPDAAALFDVYRETGRLELILGPLHGRMEVSTPEGSRMIYHRTVYDFESLRAMLHAAQFTDVHRYDWRMTGHAEEDDFSQAYIPHLDKTGGKLISLNVEAARDG
jgi:predicted SAM-dependent methyltransferase